MILNETNLTSPSSEKFSKKSKTSYGRTSRRRRIKYQLALSKAKRVPSTDLPQKRPLSVSEKLSEIFGAPATTDESIFVAANAEEKAPKVALREKVEPETQKKCFEEQAEKHSISPVKTLSPTPSLQKVFELGRSCPTDTSTPIKSHEKRLFSPQGNLAEINQELEPSLLSQLHSCGGQKYEDSESSFLKAINLSFESATEFRQMRKKYLEKQDNISSKQKEAAGIFEIVVHCIKQGVGVQMSFGTVKDKKWPQHRKKVWKPRVPKTFRNPRMKFKWKSKKKDRYTHRIRRCESSPEHMPHEIKAESVGQTAVFSNSQAKHDCEKQSTSVPNFHVELNSIGFEKPKLKVALAAPEEKEYDSVPGEADYSPENDARYSVKPSEVSMHYAANSKFDKSQEEMKAEPTDITQDKDQDSHSFIGVMSVPEINEEEVDCKQLHQNLLAQCSTGLDPIDLLARSRMRALCT